MNNPETRLDLFSPDIDLSTLCLRCDPTAVITDIYGWDGKSRVGVDYERGGQGYYAIVYRSGQREDKEDRMYDIILKSEYKGK